MTDILNAFYHRGRKAFLPMTSADLGRKMGVSPEKAGRAVKAVMDTGHAIVTVGRCGNTPVIYELTQSGRNVVMARMVEGVM